MFPFIFLLKRNVCTFNFYQGAKNTLFQLTQGANDVIIILVIDMKLKEIRTSKNLTQTEAANILSVSVRSYKDYENVIEKFKTPKYHYLCETLAKYNTLDEEHGLLKLEYIKEYYELTDKQARIVQAWVYREHHSFMCDYFSYIDTFAEFADDLINYAD